MKRAKPPTTSNWPVLSSCSVGVISPGSSKRPMAIAPPITATGAMALTSATLAIFAPKERQAA